MIIDGKKIAEEVYAIAREKVRSFSRAPRLDIFTCAPNFETQRYLALKQKKATAIGVAIMVHELQGESTTEDLISAITDSSKGADGIIVQLPLPAGIDTERVLSAIPCALDVDGLNPHTKDLLSPVVGSIQKILEKHSYDVKEKLVTIIGSGRLVGLPAYRWFQEQGAHVSVVTKDTHEIEHYTKNADVVVCGAGVSGLLTPTMIKEGVVILDAGTSEDGGELRGDADPACADTAALFTPVPGGIGPITIAILLSNVVECALKKGDVI